MKDLVRENVTLAPLTTLGVGGPARYFIHADSEKTVIEADAFARDRNLPVLVLGGGSNLVIADEGFPGLAIQITTGGIQWIDDGPHVRVVAGAGENWDRVVAEAVGRNLSGMECLSGIPGSVGGTPVQNVGAYGQEVAETLIGVRAFDREKKQIVELSRKDCGFTYRTSIFNSTARGRYIVTSVTYLWQKDGVPSLMYPDLSKELEGRSQPSLTEVRAAVRRIRARKSMLLQDGDPNCRSAGSFFKNPIVSPAVLADIEKRAGLPVPHYPAADGQVKLAAAWLIEQAGISRGYRRGPVSVSTRHTLALVCGAGATTTALLALAAEIRSRVEEHHGVRLEVEPVLVGNWGQTGCFPISNA